MNDFEWKKIECDNGEWIKSNFKKEDNIKEFTHFKNGIWIRNEGNVIHFRLSNFDEDMENETFA